MERPRFLAEDTVPEKILDIIGSALAIITCSNEVEISSTFLSINVFTVYMTSFALCLILNRSLAAGPPAFSLIKTEVYLC